MKKRLSKILADFAQRIEDHWRSWNASRRAFGKGSLLGGPRHHDRIHSRGHDAYLGNERLKPIAEVSDVDETTHVNGHEKMTDRSTRVDWRCEHGQKFGRDRA